MEASQVQRCAEVALGVRRGVRLVRSGVLIYRTGLNQQQYRIP